MGCAAARPLAARRLEDFEALLFAAFRAFCFLVLLFVAFRAFCFLALDAFPFLGLLDLAFDVLPDLRRLAALPPPFLAFAPLPPFLRLFAALDPPFLLLEAFPPLRLFAALLPLARVLVLRPLAFLRLFATDFRLDLAPLLAPFFAARGLLAAWVPFRPFRAIRALLAFLDGTLLFPRAFLDFLVLAALFLDFLDAVGLFLPVTALRRDDLAAAEPLPRLPALATLEDLEPLAPLPVLFPLPAARCLLAARVPCRPFRAMRALLAFLTGTLLFVRALRGLAALPVLAAPLVDLPAAAFLVVAGAARLRGRVHCCRLAR